MHRLLTGGIWQNTKHGGHITYARPEGSWKSVCMCMCQCVCKVEAMPAAMSHTLSHSDGPHIDSQWGLNLLYQGDLNFSPSFARYLYSYAPRSLFTTPHRASKTEFNFCVWKFFFFFFDADGFFFFQGKWWRLCVWEWGSGCSRYCTAYSWPFCFPLSLHGLALSPPLFFACPSSLPS